MHREANFAAAGISEVNYDCRLMAETSQTRGIAYREVWAQLSSKPTVMINMAYDAVGNRKSIATTYANLSQTTSTRYFAYDEMNRQTVVDAVDASLNLGQVGHRVTYDKAGNRTSDCPVRMSTRRERLRERIRGCFSMPAIGSTRPRSPRFAALRPSSGLCGIFRA